MQADRRTAVAVALRWGGRWLAGAAELRAHPTQAAVTTEAFLTRFGLAVVSLALPLFALSLGMAAHEVGLMYALRTATTVMIKPVMAWAADRFGRRQTLLLAVVVRCLVGFLFIFASAPWHLFAIRILAGVTSAARDPSATALLATHSTKGKRGTAFAWYHTARDLGRAVGFAAAGFVIQFSGNYRLVFLAAFLSSCASLVTVARYVRENRDIAERLPVAATEEFRAEAASQVAIFKLAPGRALAALRGAWRRYRRLLDYAGFCAMVASSTEMMSTYFPIIAIQYAHLAEAQVGLMVSATSLLGMFGGPFFGWLSDHVSRKVALGTRSVANTLSSLLYIVAPGFGGFMVARLVDETGKAAYRPAWGAMMAEVGDGDPQHRSRTMTFVDTAGTVGETLGPIAAGLLMSGFGVPVMLGARAALAIATEIHAIRIFKSRPAEVRA